MLTYCSAKMILIILLSVQKHGCSVCTLINVFQWLFKTDAVTPPVNKYIMGGTCLKSSNCEKDMGVYIDNKITYDTHINNMVFKANRVLAVVRNTFDYMDEDIFRLIFKGLIRPLLEYAWPIWSPHTVYQKEMIENVQRRATKLIPGYIHLSYPERLCKLKIPTLSYRRTRGDMIQVFKLTAKEGGYD